LLGRNAGADRAVGVLQFQRRAVVGADVFLQAVRETGRETTEVGGGVGDAVGEANSLRTGAGGGAVGGHTVVTEHVTRQGGEEGSAVGAAEVDHTESTARSGGGVAAPEGIRVGLGAGIRAESMIQSEVGLQATAQVFRAD